MRYGRLFPSATRYSWIEALAHIVSWPPKVPLSYEVIFHRMGPPSESATETTLVEVSDADFDWMLAGAPEHRGGLALPPGGVDDPVTLRIVCEITRQLHAKNRRFAWMMVSGGEIVGLCSFRRAPADGVAEIGYGVAQSRRGRGHATRAIAAMIDAASAHAGVCALVAETSRANPASGVVLERNGFEQMGTRIDPEDGEVLTWRKTLTSSLT